MKAPAAMAPTDPFFTETPAGRVYRQIDDELLSAFEQDFAGSGVTLPHSVGMMVARIRQAEKDRDALLAGCERLLKLIELLMPSVPWAKTWNTGDWLAELNEAPAQARRAIREVKGE